MRSLEDRNRSVNLWTARVVPIVLLGVKGYATYVLVSQLCISYLLNRGDRTAAIPILCIYFFTFTLMIISLTRLLYVTTFHPPYIPLGSAAIQAQRTKRKLRSEEDALSSGEYDTEKGRNDPDSAGLELFYTKNCFVTEADGRPIWCSHCATWKLDRTHHDSTSGRCIAKMDHFCPWVGGPIGENNFKYFIQYTFWTALYCLHLLIVMAIYIRRQISSPSDSLNRQFIAILALASFFFLFTASMCGTSVDLAIKNLTTVERLRAKSKVHILAIRKPHSSQTPGTGAARSYKAPYREITYPLDASLFSSTPGPGTFAAGEARDNNSAQHDQSNPATAQQNHVTQAKVPTTSPIDDSEQQTRYPVVANSEGHVSSPRPVTDSTNPYGHQTMEGGTRQPELSRTQPFPHGESARDLQASRTFAIVHTLEPGDNPWDLGSAILNLNTVMGNSILEWFLPTASPCANHESTESQFALGPAVKRLRAEYGLVEQEGASDMVDGARKANLRHSSPKNLRDRNTPIRVHHDNQSVHPSDNYIKLQDLSGRAVHS